MKKIYFACSIRSGRDDQPIYAELAEEIKSHATLLSELFASNTLTVAGSPDPSEKIWENDTNWIKKADAVIAEVTNPSLGVGYEIAKAEEWGKPVLALFRDTGERKLSAMIGGSPHTKTIYYKSVSEAGQAIADFIRAFP